MEALLNALAAPSAFSSDFKRLKAFLPFAVAFALSLLATVLIAPVTMEFAAKQSASLATPGTREYGIFYGFAVGGQIIALLVKWTFATFFLGTLLQFANQSKQQDNSGASFEEIPFEEVPSVEYGGVLQLVAYSGVILALEGVVKAFVVVVQNYRHALITVQDLDVSIGLNFFLQKAHIGVFLYAFLGEINLITLWGYGVLAYWIVSIYRIRRSVALSAVGGLWLVCTLLVASIQAFSANMTGAAR